jgi:flagellar basal-body rod modification protein FlgD
MSVSSISSSDPSALASAAGSPGAESADGMQQRFLKLFVAQLNNQDPLNPLDNAQLTSQLAQMSTVSGIQSMQKTLTSLLDATAPAQLLQAANLVGHAVLSKGNELQVASGEGATFQISLPTSAASVQAVVSDGAGNTVRTFELGAQAAGTSAQTWDGLDDAGQPVADGAYTVKVAASNGGQAVAVDTLVYGQVASVAQGAPGQGVAINLTSGRSVPLADVQALR